MTQQENHRTIGPGDILVEKSALLPQALRLAGDSTATGWARVADNLDGLQLEKELSAAGWTFFYMANKIRATVFGFEKKRMMQSALQRLITAARLQKCNCLEIDDVAAHSFLGLPYISFSAHPRHIQKGTVFSGQ
ncbi:MAG: hypothetical protein JJE04_26120 [Acidobacteriia bacterium]|nr:hypothetical protein [Terriglobia bacterium]